METFLNRNYRLISTALILAIAGLAFYVGMLEGRGQGNQSVALNCSDSVLSTLAIPTEALARGAEPAVLGTALAKSSTPAGAFAGSKNGTKYYTPNDCPTLERIKPENRIWFQTAEDATLQGYTPGNC